MASGILDRAAGTLLCSARREPMEPKEVLDRFEGGNRGGLFGRIGTAAAPDNVRREKPSEFDDSGNDQW